MMDVGVVREEKVEEEVKLEQKRLRAWDVFTEEMELLQVLSRTVHIWTATVKTVEEAGSEESQMRAVKANYNAVPRVQLS